MSKTTNARPRVSAGPTLCSLVVAAGLFASAKTSAQDYLMRDIGVWTVAASQDKKGCFLSRVYPGHGGTTLLFGLELDGSNRLSVLNSNWSIKEKDRHSLTFRLSNASFPKHLAVGMASDGKRGFVTSFGKQFPAHIAASTFLHIFRGSVPVEWLSLEGSGAAVAELRRCVDLHRGTPATEARGSGSAGQIPLDPFSPEAGRRRNE
jgi:hypothetical protein